jgi:tryptophan halogenase
VTGGRLRTVAVVGDGIAGWSTAAALKARVPGLSVALVPVAGLKPGAVDLFGQAAPSVGEFHRDIGLGERDVVVRTGAAYRLGTRFVGWTANDSVHGYGPAGISIDGVPFATLWSRDGDGERYDSYAPAAALGLAGRFVPASGSVLGGYSHGLQLDLPIYRRFIEAYARHLGVVVTASGYGDVEIEKGRAKSVRFVDGGQLVADLYVDATNAEARMIDTLAGNDWQDWSAWLPCDSVMLSVGLADTSLPSLDRIEARDAGWQLTSALPSRIEGAFVYASGYGGSDEGDDIMRFKSGRRARAWIGNVVAIGEAHCVVEPLEAAPLHLLHTQIDRLVASLPDRDFAEVELAYYNRTTGEEADRLRDFLILHYAIADRPEPFWRDIRAMTLPPLLAETLALFGERGRLPIRDGESFDRSSWQSVLLGSGVIPRRADVVASGVDPARTREAMAAYRTRLQAAVAGAPSHRDYLTRLRTGV